MAFLKLNLLGADADLTANDRVIIYPAAGFSETDSPEADALANANPPAFTTIANLRAYAGDYDANEGAKFGKFYQHDGDLWLCLSSTSAVPNRNSTDWLQVGAGGGYLGDWAANETYKVGDVVRGTVNEATTMFRCLSDHTSNTTTHNLSNALVSGLWERDTIPDYVNYEYDAIGINSATSAVLHLYSPGGHRHGDSLLSLENEQVSNVEINFVAGGDEKASIQVSPTGQYRTRANQHHIQTWDIGALNYVDRVVIQNNTLRPGNNQTIDLGTNSWRFNKVYGREFPVAPFYGDATARDAGLTAPLDGQLALVGDNLQVRKQGAWVTPHDDRSVATRFTELTDTPTILGTPGYGVAVNNTGDALEFKFLNTGWVRDPSRDISLGSLSPVGLSVDADNSGLAFLHSSSSGQRIYKLPFVNGRWNGELDLHDSGNWGTPEGLVEHNGFYYMLGDEYIRRFDATGTASEVDYTLPQSLQRSVGITFNTETNKVVVLTLTSDHHEIWSNSINTIYSASSWTREHSTISIPRTQGNRAGIIYAYGRYWIFTADHKVGAWGAVNAERDNDLTLTLDSANEHHTGIAWFGTVLYVADQTDHKIYAYRWAGDFFDNSVIAGGVGGQGESIYNLPDWVVLNESEQSINAPHLRTRTLRHPGPERGNYGSAFNQRPNNPEGDLLIGSQYETFAFQGLMHGDLLPAGIGLFDIGKEGDSALRTLFSEDVRVRRITPRVAYSAALPTLTGLVIEDVTQATGNFESVRIFHNAVIRDSHIPNPIAGQLCYLTDTELMEFYDGTNWLDFAGLHSGEDSDHSAVAHNILPALDQVYRLGTAGKRWSHVWGSQIVTNTIIPETTSDDSPLRIGRDTHSKVYARGDWDFSQARIQNVATTISNFGRGHTDPDPGIVISIADDNSQVLSNTTITPASLVQALAAYANPSQGQTLVINASGNLEWDDLGVDSISITGIAGGIHIRLNSGGGSEIASGTISGNHIVDAIERATQRLITAEGIAVPAGRSDDLAIQVVQDTDTGIHFHSSQFSVQLNGQEALRLAPEPSQESLPTLTIPHHLRVGAGTTEDVSIARTADSNTGILFDPLANNTIGLCAFGTEVWRITQAGNFIPDPRDEMDLRANIGDPANAHTRVGIVYTHQVNYQTLVQDSRRNLKFGIGDMTDAESIEKLNDLRVRKFKYKSSPDTWLAGLVADEIRNQADILKADNTIDTTTLLAQLLYWVQRLQDGQDALFGGGLQRTELYNHDINVTTAYSGITLSNTSTYTEYAMLELNWDNGQAGSEDRPHEHGNFIVPVAAIQDLNNFTSTARFDTSTNAESSLSFNGVGFNLLVGHLSNGNLVVSTSSISDDAVPLKIFGLKFAAARPAARTYTRDNGVTARGVPPAGYNADGSRQED